MKRRVSCASAILAILCLACLANLGCAGVSSAHSNTTVSPPTFSINGTISPAANGSGVTVTLSGAASASTTTDSNGNYSFTGLSSGNYELTPSKTGFSFSPSSQSTTLSTTSVTGMNFTVNSGSGSGLSISGNISPATAGITVSLSGAVSATAVTDSNGNYSFNNLASGDYTITPSAPGVSFSPSSQSATLSTASVTGINFTASATSSLSISGNISPASSGAGVTLTLSGAASSTTTTDSNGNYSFTGLSNGDYTITPSMAGFSFSPSSQSAVLSTVSVTGINFTVSSGSGSGLSISGSISPAANAAGVTMLLSGAVSATTVTDSNGNYSFGNLISGDYTIIPTMTGSSFSPSSQSATLSTASVTGVNFTVASGFGSSLGISGSITPATNGTGVTLTLTGAASATTATDNNGNYSFANLAVGNYTIVPTKAGVSFSPSSQSAMVTTASVTGVDFNASGGSGSGLSISGNISPAANGTGVTVALSGAASATTVTDSNGNYSFGNLVSGNYAILPTKAGVSFSPSSQSATVTTVSVAGVNFTASSGGGSGLSISGNISPATTGAGVSVALSGAVSASTITDSNGNYSFGNLVSGNYVLTPSQAGFSFSPSSQSTTLGTTSVTGVNFTSSAIPGLSISGNMTPVSNGTGVTVNLSGTSSATTTTDSTGYFGFYGLAAGTYTLTPSKTGFDFSPTSRQIATTTSNVGGINFVVYPASQSSPPIVINGQNGTVIENLTITSTSGDCVTIINSTNITIQNSEIGPCAGNGIVISGGSGINIFDSYIHPETQSQACCDNNDGIFAKTVQNLLVQGNVIAYSESNIEVLGSSDVTALGNLLLNPRGDVGSTARGDNFQCAGYPDSSTTIPCSNVTVQDNYALSSLNTTEYLYPEDTQDSINFFESNGILAQNNYITGGHSVSGCALNADNGANSADFENNVAVNTGQCGIGIHDGTNQVMNENMVFIQNPVQGGGNQAMVVDQLKHILPCGPVQVSNNISVFYQLDGTLNGFYHGVGCDPVTLTNNTFGAAAVPLLTPLDQVLPPPSIPPQPKNCVVLSPYSTQTSSPACTR